MKAENESRARCRHHSISIHINGGGSESEFLKPGRQFSYNHHQQQFHSPNTKVIIKKKWLMLLKINLLPYPTSGTVVVRLQRINKFPQTH